MPVMTHVAESREEWEMFRHARGELYDFMARLDRWMHDCHRGHTPLRHVLNYTALGVHWILAHMNELDESDFVLLASLPRGERPSIVHCPGSHRYFRHAPFPMAKLLELGMNVCLGTDSLASAESLSLFEELRSLAKTDPWLTPEQLLRTVTVNPARALHRRGQLGQLTPGALADLIAVPVSGSLRSVHEEIVDNRRPIPWTMIDGQILP